MGGSINRGAPKWMVYVGKCHSNGYPYFRKLPQVLLEVPSHFFPGFSAGFPTVQSLLPSTPGWWWRSWWRAGDKRIEIQKTWEFNRRNSGVQWTSIKHYGFQWISANKATSGNFCSPTSAGFACGLANASWKDHPKYADTLITLKGDWFNHWKQQKKRNPLKTLNTNHSRTIGSWVWIDPKSVCIVGSQRSEDGWLSTWVFRLGCSAGVLRTTSGKDVCRNDGLYNREMCIYNCNYIYI